jgi:cytochrome b561
MSPPMPAGYSGLQIVLHWLIAGLIVFLLVFGESMKEFMEAAEHGTSLDAGERFLADSHYWVGLAVLLLASFRVGLRLTQGRPAAGDQRPSLAERIAGAMHVLFYFLLFAVPATGLLVYYVSEDFGEIHEMAKPVFIVTIAVHAAAALVHQFWMKDGTLARMIIPAR